MEASNTFNGGSRNELAFVLITRTLHDMVVILVGK